MGRFQEAIQVLNSIQNRDASWYYLYAISNYSIGNQIAAMEAAERACQMDPSNQQYRQLYAICVLAGDAAPVFIYADRACNLSMCGVGIPTHAETKRRKACRYLRYVSYP